MFVFILGKMSSNVHALHITYPWISFKKWDVLNKNIRGKKFTKITERLVFGTPHSKLLYFTFTSINI